MFKRLNWGLLAGIGFSAIVWVIIIIVLTKLL